MVIAVNGDACDPLSFVSHTTKVRGEGRGEEEEEEEGVGEGCAGRMGGMEGRGSEGREEEREGEERREKERRERREEKRGRLCCYWSFHCGGHGSIIVTICSARYIFLSYKRSLAQSFTDKHTHTLPHTTPHPGCICWQKVSHQAEGCFGQATVRDYTAGKDRSQGKISCK